MIARVFSFKRTVHGLEPIETFPYFSKPDRASWLPGSNIPYPSSALEAYHIGVGIQVQDF